MPRFVLKKRIRILDVLELAGVDLLGDRQRLIELLERNEPVTEPGILDLAGVDWSRNVPPTRMRYWIA